jgi:hypothetical protein
MEVDLTLGGSAVRLTWRGPVPLARACKRVARARRLSAITDVRLASGKYPKIAIIPIQMRTGNGAPGRL